MVRTGMKKREVGGNARLCWCCWVEVVEGGFAAGSAVVIDVALGEGGAKPPKERAATRVRGKRGVALSPNLSKTVEFGV